ncbi:leucine-rich repeat protein [Perkinsela sp. CCAP 1560/4]|nr:leucine-rich repeat protein [Perkinsela sp. CCAP 1560/4]|eukprot:KNH06218.1 leucine-rich repeat protein [Perkinsela sp. CCAP 1560/4]
MCSHISPSLNVFAAYADNRGCRGGTCATTLMDRFFADFTAEGKEDLSQNGASPDYCEWQVVTCVDGNVTEMVSDGPGYGAFDIPLLPPTVQNIDIAFCEQSYELSTRALPRELERCSFYANCLFGTVDFGTLPEKLIQLWLSENMLSADPMDGHLHVVGRTSTPSWGKPGATRYCWDPPWQYRVATGASTVYHCRGPLASVATKVYL